MWQSGMFNQLKQKTEYHDTGVEKSILLYNAGIVFLLACVA